MPKIHSFLTDGGDKRFLKATSRLFHSRNDQALLLIDETLRAYLTLPHTAPNRPILLLGLRVRANNYIDQHRDPTGAQRHGFRLPIVESLLKEVEEAIQSLPKPQPPPAPQPQPQPQFQPQPPVHNAVRAQANWSMLRNRVQQVIPNGSLPKDGKYPTPRHLAFEPDVSDFHPANNWLEVLHDQHIRGDKLYPHFVAWQQQTTHRSFRDYLNQLPQDTRDSLAQSSVYYVQDLIARALFEAHLDGGLLKSRMTPTLQDEIVKTRGTGDARQRIRELASQSGEPQPVDTAEWPALGFKSSGGKGWVCFVLSMYNTLYIGKHISGTFHHSSLLAGAPILAAGMLRVVKGVITDIDGKNGHYKATSHDLRNLLRLLQRHGLDLSQINVIPFDEDPINAKAFAYDDMKAVTGLPNQPPQPKPVPPIPQPVAIANPQPAPKPVPQLQRKYV